MLLIDRPHQRGRAPQFFLRVHVRSGCEQQLDRLRAAVARREHQDGLSVRSALLRVRPGLQQGLDHRRVAVERGHGQRRHALAIGHIRLRAGANEHVRRFQVVTIHRPMKRRGAIHLGSIHVGLPLQQRANGGSVSFHDRVRDLAAAGSPWRNTGHAEQQQRDTSDDSRHRHRFPSIHEVLYRVIG